LAVRDIGGLQQTKHLHILATAVLLQPGFEQPSQSQIARGQRPAGERRGVIEGPGLLFEQRQIVQRIEEHIRVGQALGFSPKEIATLMEKRRKGRLPLKGRIEMMRAQLAKLNVKAIELERLRAYVRGKIDWQEHGKVALNQHLISQYDT
jgi:DNA-binding transcriptional MerR regulator